MLTVCSTVSTAAAAEAAAVAAALLSRFPEFKTRLKKISSSFRSSEFVFVKNVRVLGIRETATLQLLMLLHETDCQLLTIFLIGGVILCNLFVKFNFIPFLSSISTNIFFIFLKPLLMFKF